MYPVQCVPSIQQRKILLNTKYNCYTIHILCIVHGCVHVRCLYRKIDKFPSFTWRRVRGLYENILSIYAWGMAWTMFICEYIYRFGLSRCWSSLIERRTKNENVFFAVLCLFLSSRLQREQPARTTTCECGVLGNEIPNTQTELVADVEWIAILNFGGVSQFIYLSKEQRREDR